MTIREVSTLACWVAILASFVLSFSTWLALGMLAGFGVLAVALPFCVDGYVVTSLTTWLTPGVSDRLARFARANLYSVGLVGVAAQAGYHGWLAFPEGATGWPGRSVLATAVGALPMAIATLAVHIRARAVREPTALPQSQPDQSARTTASATPLASATLPRPASAVEPSAPPTTRPAQHSQPVTIAPAPVTPEQPAARVVTPEPPRQAPPRQKVEQSGSGPRRSVTVDDVRPLVRAGLGATEIAARLGASKRTVTRRIADVRAESGRLVAVP